MKLSELPAAFQEIAREGGAGRPSKRRKYGNVPVTVDGHDFASGREARRYATLAMLEKIGDITQLELQPRFPIVVNGVKIGTYVGDFRYRCGGSEVVEDSKGVRTPVYRLKKKLVEALFPVKIEEV